jgi:CheY-like chemotaxis protein
LEGKAIMKDEGKTRKQLIEELVNLRNQLAEVEKLKILEKQFFEARKMEAAGRLTGGIAHDLNNILGAIVGYSELAALDKDEAIRRNHIDEVLKASERAMSLVGQILAFSHRTEEEKKPIDMRIIVKEASNLHGREHILFVDDDKGLAKLGRHILEGLGYHVTTRTNSIEAIKTFQDSPDAFDLVITDMNMPHMTGGDLVQELIRARPDIPVILCTGFSECMTEEKAMQLGIKAFMMKPLTRKGMAKVVRDVLDRLI